MELYSRVFTWLRITVSKLPDCLRGCPNSVILRLAKRMRRESSKLAAQWSRHTPLLVGRGTVVTWVMIACLDERLH